MEVDAAGSGDAPLSQSSSNPAAMSGTARMRLNLALWLVVVIGGVAVIVLGVLVVHTWHDGAPVGEDVGSGTVQAVDPAPASDTQSRSAVLSAAERFVVTFMNVDYRTMDSTFAKVRALQTPKARTQFEKSVDGTRKLLRNLKVHETAQVVAAGLSSLDAHDAKVLVATKGTKTSSSSRGQKIATYGRVVVDLENTGGRWLVSNITFLANS